MNRGVAVVTGASSGIGAATAHRLAAEGFQVVLGARRTELLAQVAAACGGTAVPLDVTEPSSVAAFCAQVPACRVLVNNAGGAWGVERVEDAVDEHWQWMLDVNVLGVMRMTRALLPALVASGDGHVVMLGSIAGFDPYPGGAGYNAAKFGLRAMTQVLRMELLGRPVRVTEIDPGMVETDFSLVRFEGDAERAEAVYRGIEALSADDIADCVGWAVTRPSHVNIDQIVVKPREQATAMLNHRRPAT